MREAVEATGHEPGAILGGLYGDGIIALAGPFDVETIDGLRADMERLFAEAQAIPGGALPRGPQRWYVEIQPERIAAFVAIVTHPWFVAVCETVLGPDYRIVEVGFDIPFPGAADQPWHRDFAMPEATRSGRRLNSLAFNLTGVDTTAEMGPFEIAPGTQWDIIDECPRGMFPAAERWARYAQRRVAKLPKRGDISARSALTIHRGTANQSAQARPVLVIGVDAPDATNAAHHDLQLTRDYAANLPASLLDRISCRLVDRLEPVVQHHVIDGLLAPAY